MKPTLKDGSGREEALHIGDAKRIGAFSDRLSTGSVKSISQERDMSGLVSCNGLDVVVNILGETGGLEMVDGEVCKTLSVEGVF